MEKHVYTTATRSIIKAIRQLISCSQYGHYCWIDRVKNNDAENPIMIPNPLLDDPNNWMMLYGTNDKIEDLKKAKYHNETERDLTLNCGQYYHTYRCKKCGYLFDMAKKRKNNRYDYRCSRCRSEDIEQELTIVRHDGDITFFTHWQPKKGISYWTPKPMRRKVFQICYSNEKKEMSLYQKILVSFAKPFRFIPRYSVLRMGKYTNYTFSIGGITSGFRIEFQIPREFCFKN